MGKKGKRKQARKAKADARKAAATHAPAAREKPESDRYIGKSTPHAEGGGNPTKVMLNAVMSDLPNKFASAVKKYEKKRALIDFNAAIVLSDRFRGEPSRGTHRPGTPGGPSGTLLHYAAGRGLHNIIKKLLQIKNIDVNPVEKTSSGGTPLKARQLFAEHLFR